jgi:hypothetical protein
MPDTLPAYFIGHGNPMNALQANRYTEGWHRIGRETPRPSAILAISAHWYVPGTGVTVSPSPRTIHDFGGFLRELYQVKLASRPEFRVTLLDKNNYQQFQPLLSPLPGWPHNAAFPLRGVLHKSANIDVKMAEVVSADLATRALRTSDEQTYQGET